MPVLEYIDSMWDGIHMMCKTYGYNKDIKYLECFIYSCLVIIPKPFDGYLSAAKKWIDKNKISRSYPPKWATDEINSGLFSWSIDLHLYLDKKYKLVDEKERITGETLCAKYEVKNLFKDVWGPALWRVIHLAPLIIDDDDETKFKTHSYKALMSCLQIVLPCPVCRVHFRKNLPKIMIDDYIHSPRGLFLWSVAMHNEVNSSLNKKIYTVDEALSLYN